MKACPQCGKTFEDASSVCPDDNATLTQLKTDGDPLVGKLLDGKYRLLQKIGEGGMGCIYRAVHTEMGRTCAIKLLTAVSPGKEDALARFKREAKMASRIDSSHAVTIYDFGASEDGTMFLAMEFIDGRPLSKVIATERPLQLDRVVRITQQIAQGLNAAHALEIVHRDLKPDNIMVTRKGADADFVKVLDFGIAKTVAEEGADHLTKTGFVLGTPVYMSPEQLLGEKLDPRSDIYSLAIIVYEMLCGRLPFEGDNPQAVMMKRVMSDPIRLRNLAPRVSESIERVVMDGLARDRESRPPTAELFAAALQQALMGQTQVLGGRATERISDQGSTQQWSVLQSRPESGGTEYAHSVMAKTPEPSQLATPQQRSAPTQSSTQSQGSPLLSDDPRAYETKVAVDSPISLQPPDPLPVDSPPYAVPAPTGAPVSIGHQITVQPAPPRSRAVLLAAAGLGLVAFLVLLYIILPIGGSKFTLALTGAPPGASVELNDKEQGTISRDGTLTLSGLEAGPAKLVVRLAGYSEFTSSIEGKTGETRSVEARLLPLEITYGGSKMVLVDAGEFQMGDDTHEPDERPLHMVSLPAFYIDRYEVTNRQYRGFCDAAQHPYPASWQGAVSSSTSEPDYPVVGIEFDDAAAFAASVGKRLPTEQEWEKAAGWDPARPGRRVYPWGDEFIPNQANTTFNKPTSVGKYSGDKSAYGAFDMAGNAPEWVDAIYGAYPNSSFQQTRDTVGNGVVRGFVLIAERTSGFKASEWTRAALRGPLPRRFPQGGAILVGARCAISADDPRLRDNINARIREGAGGSR